MEITELKVFCALNVFGIMLVLLHFYTILFKKLTYIAADKTKDN